MQLAPAQSAPDQQAPAHLVLALEQLVPAQLVLDQLALAQQVPAHLVLALRAPDQLVSDPQALVQ